VAKWRDGRPSNRAGTCLWCGDELRAHYVHEWPVGQAEPSSTTLAGYGYSGESAFCSLRCGYSYGLTLARGGHRLTRVELELRDLDEAES
jgi:hypothetical protein